MSDGKPLVFVSHCWLDKQKADEIACDLETVADVWIDYRALRPGERFDRTIDEVLADVDLVVVVWTPKAEGSDGVLDELDTCRRLGTKVVFAVWEADGKGGPVPALPAGFETRIAVDFRHPGTGRARLAHEVVRTFMDEVPAEVPRDEAPSRLVQYLDGYLSFLTGHGDKLNDENQRGYFTSRIVDEVERYLDAGGNPDLVRALLTAARASTVDDPEGLGELVTRLSARLGEREEGADPLTQRLRGLVPEGSEAEGAEGVRVYLRAAPIAVRALQARAAATRSEAGAAVVSQLLDYLSTADDLVPDGQGELGLVDDAWLILNTTYRLVESGILPLSEVPVDWATVIRADPLVQALIPAPALQVLHATVMRFLQLIAEEIAAYQPWLASSAHGRVPAVSGSASSGVWEDDVHEMALRLGISLNP